MKFLQKTTSVLITKDIIQAAHIRKDKLKDGIEMEWTMELLDKAISAIQKNLSPKQINLVLDEKLTITLNIGIPLGTPKKEEKNIIFQTLKEKFPNLSFEESLWSYTIQSTEGEMKEIVAYVPKKKLFKALKKSLADHNISVQELTLKKLTQKTHDNPLIAAAQLASQKDQSSSKKSPKDPKSKTQTKSSLEEDPKSKSSTKLLTTILIILGVVIVSAAALYAIRLFGKNLSKPSPSPNLNPITSPSPTPISTPEPELDKYSVQILNGSGVAGQAGSVKSLLQEEGFKNFSVGNADTFDYTQTELTYSSEIPDSVKDKLQTALKDSYSPTASAKNLPSDSEHSIQIIVGEKNE